MLHKLKAFNTKNNFINLLFATIPLSFIAGNLVLNLNILLFILTAIIFFKGEIFRFKYDLLDKLIVIFFSYILLIAFLNYSLNYKSVEEPENFIILIKSFFYLRFLILYFVIKYLLRQNKINLKIFFFSASFCSLFVCLDLIFQLIYGFDIFGYKSTGRRLSGPFGDELIAGSYLQRFSLFLIFIIPLFYKTKNNKLFIITLSLIITLIIFSLIIAGNRMPLTLFLSILFLILILERNVRKLIIPFILISSAVTLITYNYNSNVKDHFNSYNKKISEFIIFLSTIYSEKSSKIKNSHVINLNGKQIQIPNTYIKEFNSGYQTWLKNKYVGDGIKSFKKNCKKTNVHNCGPHPHNYYLEIMADLGLVGLILLSFIFFTLIYNSFINKYFLNSNLKYNHIITPFIFLFLAEIFPIRTTGSFFTTGNATYFFLVMAITIALSKKEI